LNTWQWIVVLLALGLAAALGVVAAVLYARLGEALRTIEALQQRFEESRLAQQRISGRDGLTGVANRRLFDETFAREWGRAQRAGASLALLMADIDHFKKHNDQYGHQAGDDCLKQVAAALAAAARRAGDLVARYGGEEFAVLLPGMDVASAAALAERMRKAVEAIRLPYVEATATRHVGVSIGVAAVVPGGSLRPEALVSAADEALYRAKAVGRNQVIVAEPLTGN
jgi:diguanylate cyclase (GGDEF)-like protein